MGFVSVAAPAAPLDLFIVAASTAGIVALGLIVSRRQSNAEDYFLASRAARWPAIGLALFASNISSTAIIGLAGAAYALGVSVYDYEWSAALILVFFCLFLLPSVLASRVYTMPEFLERRYDRRVRFYFAALTLLLIVFVDSAGALYSGSLVCRMLWPGLSLELIAATLAGAAGVYTLVGGLGALMWTESVQALLLISSASVVAVAAFAKAGGWHSVMTRVNPAMLSLVRPIGDPGVPWPGLVFGIPVLGFYYWCTNQFIVQRVLSARSLDDGRRGALLAGMLKLSGLFLMVLPGTCAIVLFPNLKHTDQVYPTLMFRLLPKGLLGFVAAGFVAATLASVSSALNCASALITMDLVQPLAGRIAPQRLVRVGRVSTAGLLLVAVLWTPQIARFGALWQYLQAMLAYAVPPVVALFLGGLFWRGANAAGAIATVVFGTLCGIVLFLLTVVFRCVHLHFLYVAPLLLSIDLAILIGVSLWRRSALSVDAAALVWSGAQFRAESLRLKTVALLANYRVQAAALLAVTACIVFAFR